jgi:hypothetical protein
MIRCLFFGVLILAATSWAQTLPPIAEQIAKTYGLDSFGQIEAIRYTFNLDFGALTLSRTWVWEPQADRISYAGKDQAGQPVKATYVRSQLSSQPAVVQDEVDRLSSTINTGWSCLSMWSGMAPMWKIQACKTCRWERGRPGGWW